ncbi:MAG: 3-methyl-2-oxobutanoate hydroxymethyltransferase [Peptococcaceae bacterium]|jgi:3-methyl-2-oxobutanoate hydroxymethyltransferase|nr:3-methyl-2-oxobutanoate hydroxymethyltransferase [Peptococcaceae bacterium]
MKRFSITDFIAKKQAGQKIAMLTAYDSFTAALLDEAGIESILVGDSLGNVMLGYETTVPVTLEEMLHHTKTVSRGCKRALIVGDMPFLTYHTGVAEALRNAGRFLQEGGAQAVKIEGGKERAETVRAMVEAGIPVMGHLGLTPQSIHQLGGFKVQGRSEEAAQKLLEDALALEAAGAFAVVLECVPAALAAKLTQALRIPTIGIGGGNECDGQVLVTHDMLGIFAKPPKFVKKFAQLREPMIQAFQEYKKEVEAKVFPGPEQSY